MMNPVYRFSKDCKRLAGNNANLIHEFTKKIYNHFPEIESAKILIYFSHLPANFFRRPATMFPAKYPKSSISKRHDLVEICKEYTNLDFVIYITLDVINGDSVRKILDVSHEFQHVLQYVRNKQKYYYGCILRLLLWNKISEVCTPIEYDAIRKSKIIANKFFLKNEVDKFIVEEIANPEIRKKEFFEVFQQIDINTKYDLEKKIIELWNRHEIEKCIASLRNNPKLSKNKQAAIDMYDYANLS